MKQASPFNFPHCIHNKVFGGQSTAAKFSRVCGHFFFWFPSLAGVSVVSVKVFFSGLCVRHQSNLPKVEDDARAASYMSNEKKGPLVV